MRGLYAGSITLDQVNITIPGDQLQDEPYAKYRIQQVLNEKHVRINDLTVVVATYVEKAEVPGVITWSSEF